MVEAVGASEGSDKSGGSGQEIADKTSEVSKEVTKAGDVLSTGMDAAKNERMAREISVATPVLQDLADSVAPPSLTSAGGIQQATPTVGMAGVTQASMSTISVADVADLNGRFASAQQPGLGQQVRQNANLGTLARGVARTVAITATAILTPTNSMSTSTAIAPDLRVRTPTGAAFGEVEQLIDGVWSPTGVSAYNSGQGLEIDRAALEQAVGPLDPTLSDALQGGTIVANEARPDEAGVEEEVEAEEIERPYDPDDVHVDPDRERHILEGDGPGRGGGHRSGLGKPGKTEFPPDWTDEEIIEAVEEVARGGTVSGPAHRPGEVVVEGEVNGVDIEVIVRPDGGVRTAYPTGGDGVVRNPL